MPNPDRPDAGLDDSGPARVQRALDALGLRARVKRLPASTRTAREAAAAIGCSVAEIAKSLVFVSRRQGTPVLVVMSGSNRVDPAKLEALVGEPVKKADADYVWQQTGYAIGGVPPVGHDTALATYMDEDLFQYDTIWAAAGGPFSVFDVAPEKLAAAVGAARARLKE